MRIARHPFAVPRAADRFARPGTAIDRVRKGASIIAIINARIARA
jgi:hypothetical protein